MVGAREGGEVKTFHHPGCYLRHRDLLLWVENVYWRKGFDVLQLRLERGICFLSIDFQPHALVRYLWVISLL